MDLSSLIRIPESFLRVSHYSQNFVHLTNCNVIQAVANGNDYTIQVTPTLDFTLINPRRIFAVSFNAMMNNPGNASWLPVESGLMYFRFRLDGADVAVNESGGLVSSDADNIARSDRFNYYLPGVVSDAIRLQAFYMSLGLRNVNVPVMQAGYVQASFLYALEADYQNWIKQGK